MGNPSTEQRVIDLLRRESFARTDEEITPASTFTTSLGMDSMDRWDLLTSLESEFDIRLPDIAADCETVGQMAAYVTEAEAANAH